MATRVNMLEGNEGRTVLQLVWPMLAGALGIVLFNLVDTYFVGKLGTKRLAAMGFCFPIVLVTGSLASGIGIGASSSISQYLGRGEREKARRVATDAHLFALAFTIVLSLLGHLTLDPLFQGLGASDEVLPFIRDYMRVWYTAIPFVVLPMVGQNIIQAEGDTKTPAAFLAVAVGVNMLLDPLLIFGLGPFPELGIEGAAYATVIARGSILIGTMSVLIFRDRVLTLEGLSSKGMIRSWGKVLYIGIPATLMNIVVPLSQGAVTKLVSGYGEEAVAGVGVATRLESFAMIFILAMSMIITPFMGQNIGAQKVKRSWRGFRYASIYSLAWGALSFLLFSVFGTTIASVFNDDPEVIRISSTYLLIFSWTYGFQGVVTIASSAFNGLRQPFRAAGVSLMRLFAFYLPLALLGQYYIGMNGIFLGAALGNLISGILAFIWFWQALLKVRGMGLYQEA